MTDQRAMPDWPGNEWFCDVIAGHIHRTQKKNVCSIKSLRALMASLPCRSHWHNDKFRIKGWEKKARLSRNWPCLQIGNFVSVLQCKIRRFGSPIALKQIPGRPFDKICDNKVRSLCRICCREKRSFENREGSARRLGNILGYFSKQKKDKNSP